jgi:hypothetical protein
MRIRKRLVVCFAALLAGIGFAIPTTASAASIPVTCGTQSGGSETPVNQIADVRIGHHTEDGGFDRIVFEFVGSSMPNWTAIPKSSAVFFTDPKGERVDLQGTAGIKVAIRFITSGSYHGPTEFNPEPPLFPQLAEARQIGDSENVTSWGLGLQHQSCKRILQLSGPGTHTRLVIDVPN